MGFSIFFFREKKPQFGRFRLTRNILQYNDMKRERWASFSKESLTMRLTTHCIICSNVKFFQSEISWVCCYVSIACHCYRKQLGLISSTYAPKQFIPFNQKIWRYNFQPKQIILIWNSNFMLDDTMSELVLCIRSWSVICNGKWSFYIAFLFQLQLISRLFAIRVTQQHFFHLCLLLSPFLHVLWLPLHCCGFFRWLP